MASKKDKQQKNKPQAAGNGAPVGSVMVVGGGMAGIQAALDLANTGYYVYLVEKSPAIGGVMAQLDKTFPTNDCSMCILSPKLVEGGRHLNIKLMTMADVESLEGEAGRFTVTVRQAPRYVDMDKCIACGMCAEKCPRKVDDEFNEGLGKRKAAYVKYPQAVPLKYAIDEENCIYFARTANAGPARSSARPARWIFDAEATGATDRGGIGHPGPGFQAFDPKVYDYGYGKYPNVITSIEFERILSASGPFEGHLVRPSDKQTPKKIAWLQCVGIARYAARCARLLLRGVLHVRHQGSGDCQGARSRRSGYRDFLHGHAHLREGIRTLLQSSPE